MSRGDDAKGPDPYASSGVESAHEFERRGEPYTQPVQARQQLVVDDRLGLPMLAGEALDVDAEGGGTADIKQGGKPRVGRIAEER